jgi:hypothetical protein
MQAFSADQFFRNLITGLFDCRLCDELQRLTFNQLSDVERLMRRHLIGAELKTAF